MLESPDIRILYFIGLSTGRSSIMSLFPAWAEHLGLGCCRIEGIDLPPHAPFQHQVF